MDDRPIAELLGWTYDGAHGVGPLDFWIVPHEPDDYGLVPIDAYRREPGVDDLLKWLIPCGLLYISHNDNGFGVEFIWTGHDDDPEFDVLYARNFDAPTLLEALELAVRAVTDARLPAP